MAGEEPPATVRYEMEVSSDTGNGRATTGGTTEYDVSNGELLASRREPAAMSGPSLDDVRGLDGRRVQVVVPKPREDQRLVGRVAVDDDDVQLRLDGAAAETERFRTVELRERERDGVLRAFRSDGSLVGRVRQVSGLEEE